MKQHKMPDDFLVKRIAELKQREVQQQQELRILFSDIVESLSPAGILKSSIKDVVASPDLRTQLMDTAIGIGAGVAGKKLFVGKSDSMLKKIGGTAIEFILANFVRKKIPGLRKKAG